MRKLLTSRTPAPPLYIRGKEQPLRSHQCVYRSQCKSRSTGYRWLRGSPHHFRSAQPRTRELSSEAWCGRRRSERFPPDAVDVGSRGRAETQRAAEEVGSIRGQTQTRNSFALVAAKRRTLSGSKGEGCLSDDFESALELVSTLRQIEHVVDAATSSNAVSIRTRYSQGKPSAAPTTPACHEQ